MKEKINFDSAYKEDIFSTHSTGKVTFGRTKPDLSTKFLKNYSEDLGDQLKKDFFNDISVIEPSREPSSLSKDEKIKHILHNLNPSTAMMDSSLNYLSNI